MSIPPETLTIYGTRWCPDCLRVRRYLDQNRIAYDWIDIDKDPQAAQFVTTTNHGNRSVPTLVFPDGSILVEPSNAQLAQKVNPEPTL